jgi:uncharacterized membrane protein YbaN (DUF454 family)
MARRQPRKDHTAEELDRDEDETPAFALDIQIDERHGLLSIYDPRAFHAGRRGFCRRLLEAAAADPGVEKAEIDLAASSCRLEFDRRSATAQTMADAFTTAVGHAAEKPTCIEWLQWWRRPSRWSALTVYRAPDGVSTWETLEERPGQIRLRHGAGPGDRTRVSGLADSLSTLDGVEGCHVSSWFGTLTLDYRPGSPIAGQLVDAVEHARRHEEPPGSSTDEIALREHPAGVTGGEVQVATGYRRLRYLALAGGSFALTMIGLVVPGIPTVPFLLATSYYLARSSPWLDDRLRRTALFGRILVEWEQYHGLSFSSKAKLMSLTLVISLVTVAVSAGSPVVLVVILVIALLSLVGIARLPGLPPEAPGETDAEPPARLALPSP